MKKESFRVSSSRLSVFTDRVVDDKARPCVFKDKRKTAELNRQRWKNEVRRAQFD